MIELTKLSELYSLVIIGNFNPAIYHPSWLFEKNLISEKDINTEKLVITNELTSFNIGKWMNVFVRPNQLEFKTNAADKVIFMKDIILGCLYALPEDPVIAFGINKVIIAGVQNEKSYYELGSRLTPLDLWNKDFKNQRLKVLTIEDGNNPDFPGSRQMITISPSPSSPQNTSQYNIQINQNQHFDIDKSIQKAIHVIEIINEHYISCFENMDKIYSNFVENINS